MQFILLFLEGIITFISPCLLPMLPVYISYFAGGKQGTKTKTLNNAIGFIIGFTVVFVIMGAFAGTIGGLLYKYNTAVNIITGAVVVLFGLNFTGIVNIPVLNKTIKGKMEVKENNLFSSILFGIVFAVGWTPCIGAFLGSALMLASQQGSTLTGVLMLLTYSMGLGIPFAISAVLIDRLKNTFDFVKRNYRVINLMSGGLLIIVGILMMSGYMGYFLSMLTF